MKNRREGVKNSRRGMTLVLAVVIVVILALLGIGLIQLQHVSAGLTCT